MIAASLLTQAPVAAQTFTNPLFKSQDPWVAQWNGNYYYSDSDGGAIYVRQSQTLTGLANASPQKVWDTGGTLTNLWAPEIHFVNGSWYLYFSADHANDRNQRLYVLRGGASPFERYGSLTALIDSTGFWAIDPDIFNGADGNLYLTWSCTANRTGAPPQSICLARMSDALHFDSATVRIAQPDAAWETHTAAIEEGPVGFTRNGSTFITYSASASWTTNDYAAGLLTNASGDLLNAGAWTKSGPILDHHGNTFGPGSIAPIASPDGTESWALYHAYDQIDCPTYACRSIRLQKIFWADNDAPQFGYPADPGTPSLMPSGDTGSPTGWATINGDWNYVNSAELTSNTADAQTIRGADDRIAWNVSADVLQTQGGDGIYGIFALYADPSNFIELHIDPAARAAGSYGVINGAGTTAVSHPLPQSFDLSAPHNLRAEKTGAGAFSFYLDGVLFDSRIFPLDRGRAGVFSSDPGIEFRNVDVNDTSFGWTNTDGLWDIMSSTSVNSVSSGGSTYSIYRCSPLYGNYSVSVDAQPLSDGSSFSAGFGLIAAYSDSDNEVILWDNVAAHTIQLISTIAGVHRRETLTAYTGSPHLSVTKIGTGFTFYVDGAEVARKRFELESGIPGVTAAAVQTHFENFTTTQN